MSGGRITRPGVTDDEYMLVTCTPDTTTAEFFEFQDEGLDAARANLHPTTSTYLAKVTHQGEHTVRGTAKHIAILVTVDAELARALQQHGVGRGRAKIATFLQQLVNADLAQIREDYQASSVGRTDPLPRDANCANCRGPFLAGQMVAKRDDHMLVHAAADCRTTDDAITLPQVTPVGASPGRGSPARMPSTEFKTVLMGEFVPFEMPANPGIRRPNTFHKFNYVGGDRPLPISGPPICLTDGCGSPAAYQSDYCPPCRSIRSGHGL